MQTILTLSLIFNTKAESEGVPTRINSQVQNVTNKAIYNDHCDLTALPDPCPNPTGYRGPLLNSVNYSGRS